MAADTNNSNSGLRVPFGLKHGRLYPPQETDRGLACGCVCPGCGSALIANQGKHKRPYFSHYQTRECAGGYESAVHLMAKQIIEDRKYIVVPSYQKTLIRKMPTGEVMKQYVSVRSQRLEFVDVRLEKTVDGLRPDVIGVTNDGAEVFIEVYVTHAVTDDKRERFAKKSLVELDLSMLPQELVADEALFAEEVLSGAGREWISCQLYREEIKAARQSLQESVKRFITEHRARIEHARIERQAEADRLARERQQRLLAEQAAEKKRIKIADQKSQLREQYSRHLEQLHNKTFDVSRQDQGLDLGGAQSIAQRVEYVKLPTELVYEQSGDWIFKTHRAVWQAFIYERFIQGQPRNILRTNDVKRAVVREFGVLEWVSELINLKYQHKVQGRSRGQWYGNKGVWFFTDSENRMIPSPYLLVLNYLKMLANERLLTLEHSDRDSFAVRFDTFTALERHKAEVAEKKRLAELEQQKRVEAELEQLRQAEIERQQKYTEDTKKRIAFLIALVDYLYVKKGVRNVKRCNLCSHFQEPNDGDLCLGCSCSKLWDVTLSISYLETLPHRLRSLRLFPPTPISGKAY